MSQGMLQSIMDATDTTSDKLREVIEEIESKFSTTNTTSKNVNERNSGGAAANGDAGENGDGAQDDISSN